MLKTRWRDIPPLKTGDVLPARQLAREHRHENGWEAVRLARPNARPCTGARLPKRRSTWHTPSSC